MKGRLNVEGLRYARAVAETGSFTAAARAYGVTQPALSNGIAKLEERLGERLFERSPRGVTQTAFGARMLPLIARALSTLDEVSAEARRWTEPGDRRIRVGVSPLIDPKLVGAAYAAACGLDALRGPRELVLREANMRDLREDLVSGDLDLILAPSVMPLPGYEHRYIASEPLLLVQSQPAAGPAEVTDLRGTPLIMVADSCGLTTFTRDLLAAHAVPHTAYPGEATSYRMLEEWAALGLGSAILPASKVTAGREHRRELREDGQVVEIFYEAVWDPRSALAAELGLLAGQVAALAADSYTAVIE
ncbi:MAG: LysR family transcriptional regulator [Actinomycetota bacterium]